MSTHHDLQNLIEVRRYGTGQVTHISRTLPPQEIARHWLDATAGQGYAAASAIRAAAARVEAGAPCPFYVVHGWVSAGWDDMSEHGYLKVEWQMRARPRSLDTLKAALRAQFVAQTAVEPDRVEVDVTEVFDPRGWE